MRVIALLALALALIGSPSLAWAQADVAVATVGREAIGVVPEDCDYSIEEDEKDGFTAQELAYYADCFVDISPEDVSVVARFEQGIALFRLEMGLRGISAEDPPRLHGPRYDILLAYAVNGFSEGFEREAEALAHFVDESPETRCSFFYRLRVELLWQQQDSAAQWLDQRFGLDMCKAYVPLEGWQISGEEPWPWFYEGWFGGQLSAMGEPTLVDNADLDGYRKRFRFSAFPNSSPAYVVRIDESWSGVFRLSWTALDGAGGYQPGDVSRSETRLLRAGEARSVGHLLERAQIANFPMEEPFQEARDDGGILICIHSTNYTFEELVEGQRSFLTRAFCGRRDDALFDLMGAMHELLPENFRD